MSRYDIRQNRKKLLLQIGILVVLLCGLAMRVYNLNLDPAVSIGQASQDLTTDPAHLTSFAANYAHCGAAEPFPFPKWQVFKISLVSGAAFILFTIGSANRVCANLAGAIPSFMGIVLFVLGILIDRDEKERRYLAAFIAASFLSFNFTLITFNRAPFLESGLIFYFGLIFFLYQKYRLRLWNLLILAFLVILSCLTGKIFGISLGMALLAMILTSHDPAKWKKMAWFVGSGIASAIILVLILFGDRFGAYYDYLHEQAFVSHGTSWFLISDLRALVSQPLIFGSQSRMFIDSPFQFLAWYVALVMILLYMRSHYHKYQQHSRLRFALYWLLALAAILVPANYRPLRYAVLLFFPIVLIISSSLSMEPKGDKPLSRAWSIINGLVLGLLNWFFLYHLITDLFYNDVYRQVGWTIITASFIPAVLMTLLMLFHRVARGILNQAHRLGVFLVIMAGLTVVLQSIIFVRWISDGTCSARDASRDLAETLSPGAVLTGPYAPTLTLDNSFMNFIYAFGLKKPDFDIFERFPITHIAADMTNRDAAMADFPVVKEAVRIAEYSLRSRVIVIWQVAGRTANPTASGYHPTDYEKARGFAMKSKIDSALVCNNRFLAAHPQNRSALLLQCVLLSGSGQDDELLRIIDRALAAAPQDDIVQFFCAKGLKRLALAHHRNDLMARAYSCLEASLVHANEEDAAANRKEFENIK